MPTQEQLDNWFTHHPPQGPADVELYHQIREAGKVFAQVINQTCPESADKTAAIRKIREAVFTSNAALACKGK